MAERTLDELGPVDYLVVEFPPESQNFTGAIADATAKLHEGGTIRLMDILFLVKNADGSVDAQEVSDIPELGELARLEADLAETLAADDVLHMAAAMDPGTLAAVIVYENLWAAPFAAAVRHAGGQLIASGRIPVQAIVAALEADEAAAGQLEPSEEATNGHAPLVAEGV